MPTPMTEPMSVCELEAGRPNHQVPRFQMMAAMSREKTMAKPAPCADLQNQFDGEERNDGEGDGAGLEARTPMRFQKPDQTTAMWGSSEWV